MSIYDFIVVGLLGMSHSLRVCILLDVYVVVAVFFCVPTKNWKTVERMTFIENEHSAAEIVVVVMVVVVKVVAVATAVSATMAAVIVC